MADETHLSILEMLSCEELCPCHILEDFDITQPTLYYHMKILVDSKLVESTKDGLLFSCPFYRVQFTLPFLNLKY